MNFYMPVAKLAHFSCAHVTTSDTYLLASSCHILMDRQNTGIWVTAPHKHSISQPQHLILFFIHFLGSQASNLYKCKGKDVSLRRGECAVTARSVSKTTVQGQRQPLKVTFVSFWLEHSRNTDAFRQSSQWAGIIPGMKKKKKVTFKTQAQV